jgi:hypothetical protein
MLLYSVMCLKGVVSSAFPPQPRNNPSLVISFSVSLHQQGSSHHIFTKDIGGYQHLLPFCKVPRAAVKLEKFIATSRRGRYLLWYLPMCSALSCKENPFAWLQATMKSINDTYAQSAIKFLEENVCDNLVRVLSTAALATLQHSGKVKITSPLKAPTQHKLARHT